MNIDRLELGERVAVEFFIQAVWACYPPEEFIPAIVEAGRVEWEEQTDGSGKNH